jgi:long-subunit acyl-CoA synthetase (AMP-forming)
MEARVVRTDGSDADADEVGELYIRGGGVTLGYLNNAKATGETFVENGWLRTGDLFKADKDGNFL